MSNYTASESQNFTSDFSKHVPIVYTVKEIAVMLHTAPSFIYRLINLGLLPALKLGSIRVRKVALEDFLAKYEGCDLSNPENIKELVQQKLEEDLAAV